MVQELYRSDWEPGNQIDDYFLEIRCKAFHAGVDMKFVAPIFASQVPKDFEGEQGRDLIKTIKRELTERGYRLDMWSKDFEKIKKAAVLTYVSSEPPPSILATNSTLEAQIPVDDTVASSRTQFRSSQCGRQPKQQSHSAKGCFIC